MKNTIARKSGNGSVAPGQKEDNLEVLREGALNLVLLFYVLIGTIVWLINLVADIPSQDWKKIVVYTLPYLGLLIITFYRKLPHLVRSLGFLLILYGIAITATLTGTTAESGLLWFMGFSVMSSVLISFPGGLLAFLLSWVTYLMLGWLVINQVLTLPFSVTWQATVDLVDWFINSLVLAIVTASLVMGISYIIHQFNRKLEKDSSVINALESEKNAIDKRVNDLTQQIGQNRRAQEISHAINTTLDPDMLLQQVVEIVRDNYKLAYAGIYLMDEQTDELVLNAGKGESGQQGLNLEHRLPVSGSSMVSWSITHQLPRIGPVAGERTMRINQPQAIGVNCEMVLPLLSDDQIFGVLTLQSNRQKPFIEDDIQLFRGIADALATAIHKNRLSQREQESLEELRTLKGQYLSNVLEKDTSSDQKSSFTYSADGSSEFVEGGPFVKMPIRFGEQAIGALSLELSPSQLSEEDQRFIEQVTNQAALAMENIRLVEETVRRTSHDRLVTDIVKKARVSADVDAILRTTLGELGKSMQASEGVIRLEIPRKSETTQSDGGEE